ncbi:MAG: hypothetical protein KAI64_03325, partial [Thermoplasmata archaeon]|nr:hypothetical protein [Thermoplasmata archaeon]
YDRAEPDETTRNSILFNTSVDRWHLSVDLARDWEKYTVYGGVQYSELSAPYEHPQSGQTRKGGFKQKNEFGIFAGFKVNVMENLDLIVEGHLIDETALIGQIVWSFR